jgi:hypothetical protein
MAFCTINAQNRSSSREIINNLKSGAAIVRIYMNKPKKDMLLKSINDPYIEANEKQKLQKMLADHEAQTNTYLQNTIKPFNSNFDFTKLYYMYDYNQRNLKNGTKNGIFLNKNGMIDSTIVLTESNFFLIGKGNNEDSFEILTQDGEKLPEDFPSKYNKTIFKSLLNIFNAKARQDKIGDYVAHLNKNLWNFFNQR